MPSNAEAMLYASALSFDRNTTYEVNAYITSFEGNVPYILLRRDVLDPTIASIDANTGSSNEILERPITQLSPPSSPLDRGSEPSLYSTFMVLMRIYTQAVYPELGEVNAARRQMYGLSSDWFKIVEVTERNTSDALTLDVVVVVSRLKVMRKVGNDELEYVVENKLMDHNLFMDNDVRIRAQKALRTASKYRGGMQPAWTPRWGTC